MEELDRRVEEYEKDPESHSHTVDIDQMMEDDGMSKQEREEEEAFSRDLLVKNCNMEIDQYNSRIRLELMKLLKV